MLNKMVRKMSICTSLLTYAQLLQRNNSVFAFAEFIIYY